MSESAEFQEPEVVEFSESLAAKLDNYQRDFVVPLQELQKQARRARAANALAGNVAPDMRGKSDFTLHRIADGSPEDIVKYRNL